MQLSEAGRAMSNGTGFDGLCGLEMEVDGATEIKDGFGWGGDRALKGEGWHEWGNFG